MRNALMVCLVSLLVAGVAHAQDDPQKELADAYAKLEALKTYRERISFKLSAMGMEDVEGIEGELGARIAAMMAPFKGGIQRENVGKRISRTYWSFPNPSPIGSEITIEMIEEGGRTATRHDDLKMRMTARALDAAAKAQMAVSSAISTVKSLAGAVVNPFGAIADLVGAGMQAAGAARAPTGAGEGDWGKWVCSTDEPIEEKKVEMPVKLEKPGTVGGKAVRRYRVLAPPDEDEAAPNIVSVDQESGLPVQVEVLNPETGQVFTVIEFYDFDAPITLEFPKCDKER